MVKSAHVRPARIRPAATRMPSTSQDRDSPDGNLTAVPASGASAAGRLEALPPPPAEPTRTGVAATGVSRHPRPVSQRRSLSSVPNWRAKGSSPAAPRPALTRTAQRLPPQARRLCPYRPAGAVRSQSWSSARARWTRRSAERAQARACSPARIPDWSPERPVGGCHGDLWCQDGRRDCGTHLRGWRRRLVAAGRHFKWRNRDAHGLDRRSRVVRGAACAARLHRGRRGHRRCRCDSRVTDGHGFRHRSRGRSLPAACREDPGGVTAKQRPDRAGGYQTQARQRPVAPHRPTLPSHHPGHHAIAQRLAVIQPFSLGAAGHEERRRLAPVVLP